VATSGRPDGAAGAQDGAAGAAGARDGAAGAWRNRAAEATKTTPTDRTDDSPKLSIAAADTPTSGR